MSSDEEKRDRIEGEVDRVLGLFDTLEDVAAGPFFYTRLQARIGSARNPTPSLIERLALGRGLAPALLALVVVLNLLTAVAVLRSDAVSQTQIGNRSANNVVDDYSLTEASSGLDIVSQ
jgi:hypothetical protein